MSDDDIQKRWEEFVSLLKKTNREGIDNLINWLGNETDFKIAPASTRYHMNCKGGLLEHSLNVYRVLNDDLQPYIELLGIPEDTIIITSLLHDVCKSNDYVVEMRNVKKDNEWVQEPFYKFDDWYPYGHGDESVDLIRDFISLSKLEKMMIKWHMGFSDRMPYDSLTSDAFTKCPQTLLLHTADVLATYFVEGNSEGMDKFSQCGFKNLFLGRSAVESIEKSKQPKTVNINGTIYEIAKETDEVDGTNVIIVADSNNVPYRVYAPHGDGLPF